jgi:predicted O-linked N-acetylglucosamine transferase (SPINDLY family)
MDDFTARLFVQARSLHQHGRLEQARALYRQVLQMEPRHFDALHLSGVLALQSDDLPRALDLFGEAIRIDPLSAAAHMHLGNALLGLNRLEAALASYDAAIRIKPDSADAYYNRAIVLRQLNRHEAAIASYDGAIALRPDHARAYNNRALALSELGRHEAALASCERAIAIEPNNAEAHLNRGNALRDLERHEAALGSFERAIELRPDYAQAYNNRGLAEFELRRHVAAIASFDRAIALDARYAEAYFNRGNVFRAQQRLDAAVDSYGRALALKSDYAEAHINLGVVLREAGEREAALVHYDRALGIKRGFAQGHLNRGAVLSELGRYEEAIESFDRAIELDGKLCGALGSRLYAKLQICDWDGWEDRLEELSERIEGGAGAENPFCVMAVLGSADLQRQAAERWVQEQCAPDGSLGEPGKRGRQERIRVGYFSADFREHPVGQLTAGLFARHDRSRFEVSAFSHGPDTGDELRRRIEGAVERFVEVRGRSDREIAQLARELQIDIAVDLGGFTQDCRPRIFALRAAPVQVSYVGYAGTLGAPYMDYLIADRRVIPAGSERHYRERIIYLPDSYLPQDSGRLIAEREFRREQFGLPPSGVVFCCFNSSYKISPGSFAGWMRILGRVAGSVLWLSGSNARAVRNLRAAAERAGIGAQRLIFAERMPSAAEHLGRHRLADLFLDTLPYNAHATASDALWAGLPVLTCLGEAFASRVAGSLLGALGLAELITCSQQAYEERAVELASHPERLADLKRRLAAQRLSAPLFDTRSYARHLESAYHSLYERYHADLPPDHITLRVPAAAPAPPGVPSAVDSACAR